MIGPKLELQGRSEALAWLKTKTVPLPCPHHQPAQTQAVGSTSNAEGSSTRDVTIRRQHSSGSTEEHLSESRHKPQGSEAMTKDGAATSFISVWMLMVALMFLMAVKNTVLC